MRMRAVTWVILNVSFIAAVVAGAVYGVVPAWNLARYCIVFFAIATTMAALHDATQKALAAKGRAVPAWISVTIDIVAVAILAATGHFVYATIHAWQASAEQALWVKRFDGPLQP